MSRTAPPSQPDSSSITPIERVRSLKEHLSKLRRRLYPILSEWPKHNLTEQDNFYGFARLDLMQEELKQLEADLSKGTSD